MSVSVSVCVCEWCIFRGKPFWEIGVGHRVTAAQSCRKGRKANTDVYFLNHEVSLGGFQRA